ncbi:DUF6745 domain-containing protein [Microbispora sp. H10836]|uniref:DUF6745 domain-containing protein n=1 Tax=Microbispora sp. H10836 TaxID=2729106 RepID=UPI0014742D62|nr:hypothetical protein [Microbispora sp. H10836]
MSVLAQREAAALREKWLGRILSTRPADRPAAEAAITGLYGLIGLAPPRFHWVPSPLTALTTLPPGLRPRSVEDASRVSDWPLTRRFQAVVTGLCLDLDPRVRRAHRGLDDWIRRDVHVSLERSMDGAFVRPVLAAHAPHLPRPAWYRTQSAFWVAHYDALRRAGAVFTAEQARQLDLWATAAASCGPWWPRQDVCVVSERPTVLRTEVWGDDGEVRPHCPDGPAVRYADGWEVHAWHGTLVPPWVITDPSVERIEREENVEVRRCAIERIGWDAYIERAGLRPVASAPDPGNPGHFLRLYDLRRETRVLLAVNGSVERDGTRRRYGLTVPGYFRDPIAAAGWTYGLSAEQYSLLVRRT